MTALEELNKYLDSEKPQYPAEKWCQLGSRIEPYLSEIKSALELQKSIGKMIRDAEIYSGNTEYGQGYAYKEGKKSMFKYFKDKLNF